MVTQKLEKGKTPPFFLCTDQSTGGVPQPMIILSEYKLVENTLLGVFC